MNYGTDFSIINKLIDEFKIYLKQISKTNNIDIYVYVFPQVWGSTALGYSGIGGSAITSSHTIVLYEYETNVVRVYFGGNVLAYEIKNPNNDFWEDLNKHNIECQSRYGKYIRCD